MGGMALKLKADLYIRMDLGDDMVPISFVLYLQLGFYTVLFCKFDSFCAKSSEASVR